jgi:indolepyruvate ferredoxin oxidoreductase alpha subunit
MTHPLLSDVPGTKHLLLGNEAIVRGALEAGVGFVSCYPGTPSTEVPDTFYKISQEGNFYFEYSVNEKVAMEVAGGAALGGVPSLVTMKHVGVNVAADPLMSLAYIGTPGGLVILSADDPGCHSSQNEQDNRYYARLAGLPCFEPATIQEAKDMMKEALTSSARWQQPVLLRTSTRINHIRGPVLFGPLATTKNQGIFEKDPSRFVPLPAIARKRHPKLLENLSSIQKEIETSPWNSLQGQARSGIIASGMTRAYLHDILREYHLHDKVKVLELGVTFPFPETLLVSFLKELDKVLILEESEPILEESVRALVQKQDLSLEVHGKDTNLTRIGEYSTQSVNRSVHSYLDLPVPEVRLCHQEANLPSRPPNLCAGCGHRAVYYAARKVFGDEAIYATDIGCYTLGFLPPLRMADFLFCMGSSISGGSGMSRATQKTVVAYIGDSTFFHSGLTGLINAVHNQHDLCIIVLDNKTTAMTGHQPHPGVDTTPFGPNQAKVDIEQVVRGCGVEQIKKIRPLNHTKTLQALEEFKNLSGVRVIIAEEPCVLFAKRTLGQKRSQVASVTEDTPEVRACLEELACPAFYVENNRVAIDEDQCNGCMLCVQVCEAIKAKKRS